MINVRGPEGVDFKGAKKGSVVRGRSLCRLPNQEDGGLHLPNEGGKHFTRDKKKASTKRIVKDGQRNQSGQAPDGHLAKREDWELGKNNW